MPFMALALSGCLVELDCESGEGPVVSHEVSLPPFHSLNLAGSGEVYLRQGSGQHVVVEGQENIIKLLKRDVRNGNWDIGLSKCTKNAELKYHITIPDIRVVAISGSGTITALEGISSETLLLKITGSGGMAAETNTNLIGAEISGSGSIHLSGIARTGNVRISGSGNVRAFGLTTENMDVSINGSGNARVNTQTNLDVKITGSGDVYYMGDPEIDLSVTGSGKLIKQEGN